MSESYTTEALVRSMAHIKSVIDSFTLETKDIINSQSRFVSLIVSISKQCNDSMTNDANIKEEDIIIDWSTITFLPSRRYIQKLLQQYISKLEECNIELQNDNLASLVCYFSMTKCSSLPDPTISSLVTFRIPKANSSMKSNDIDTSPSTKYREDDDDDDIIQIRTYPYHNDVGVAKVWEAGACLAEYIIYNPHCVEDKNVVELGAGVGLTGLIASAYKAKSVHMTDYTEVCLDNLSYNVDINEEWLRKRGVLPDSVTVGKLEWGDYSNMQNENELKDASEQSSIEAISKAVILLAADVVYDVSCIPDLVSTVSKFLNPAGSERIAIFATTYRNERTFSIFERQLEKHQIICEYEHSLEHLPNIFPCYWNQSRSDVRVCTMRKKQLI